MDEAPNPKIAKVTANFVYLGATKLFRIEVDISANLPMSVKLESSFFAEGAPCAMKSVIESDIKLLNDAAVGKSKKWKANGFFYQLKGTYTYIYFHPSHAMISSVDYSQLTSLLRFDVKILEEYADCTTHTNHDFLAPYFMDNEALLRYYQHYMNTEDASRKDNLTKSVQALEKFNTEGAVATDSCFSCPPNESNNWDENDWTKRLSYCLKGQVDHVVHYTATSSFPSHLIAILGCGKFTANPFFFRGSPDTLFHRLRAVMMTATDITRGDAAVMMTAAATTGDDDSESSSDELVEMSLCHQRPSLKGIHGSGEPEKLGEMIAAVHFVMISEVLKRFVNSRKQDQLVQAKGVLLDKVVGAIHVTMSTEQYFLPGVEVTFNCLIQKRYGSLFPGALCYHINRLLAQTI